ncbi:PREDICTED: uncharacterized protein LOC104595209 [Nelumbo nucifera]|uniref:E2 ubiquitin-conjugating enzyme n=2 Tax=Nelumbo nucifera TaxID=4432 RepID=A0A1U7ZQE2_NELNU|nr:PREDICTED: uncharacterized protein LOC104595209 [Nelumbo nucifera]DAD26941.1 TPA_asm: hypothetical protein HUJ06_028409 [Nelumbo nucifera]
MAQAARLNLRMQRELKLLLTDPPPGVTLPLLSGDADFSSLSSIDAQIEGPEGTVYAGGVFKIKIQIPERYPFQPPNVTFATPIYHPNIDNGGRICLDILNLPPKGAWQPSLNISTVLTSIGLLLSEPNPDDGLMCEASKEYKYNRQAFDQKARSMTKIYAKVETSGNGGGGNILANSNTSMVEVGEPDTRSKSVGLCPKKLYGISRKLSLESSGPVQSKDAHNQGNAMATDRLSVSQSQNLSTVSSNSLSMPEAQDVDREQPQQYHDVTTVDANMNSSSRKSFGITRKLSLEHGAQSRMRYADNNANILVSQPLSPVHSENHLSMPQAGKNDENQPHEDHSGQMVKTCTSMSNKMLRGIRRKLSLESLGPLQRRDDNVKENMVLTHRPSLVHSKCLSTVSSKSLLTPPQSGKLDEQQPHEGHNVDKQNCSMNASHKFYVMGTRPSESLGLLRKKDVDDKENVVVDKSSLSHSQYLSEDSSKSVPQAVICGVHLPPQYDNRNFGSDSFKQQEKETSPTAEEVIVLDSEDSEEEGTKPKRSRLSLARKRLAGKWKVKDKS